MTMTKWTLKEYKIWKTKGCPINSTVVEYQKKKSLKQYWNHMLKLNKSMKNLRHLTLCI